MGGDSEPERDVRDELLTLADGRVIAWTETGPPDGRPILRLPGTPGSRWSIRADRSPWSARSFRVITTERPGFGASTRLPGWGFAQHADDLTTILDHLGISALPVLGGSGGAPHVLAFAATHPDRVTCATIVVGAAPVTDAEAEALLPFNREWRRLARAGDRSGLRRFLAPERDRLYADPLGAWQAILQTADASDQAILRDVDYQRGFARGMSEALRPGVDGWADEGLLIMRDWDSLDLGSIRCSITWWHGAHDRNVPVSAVRRLAAGVPAITVKVWDDGGHLVGYRREPEVLDELLQRSSGRGSVT